jgi:hypothetical protein
VKTFSWHSTIPNSVLCSVNTCILRRNENEHTCRLCLESYCLFIAYTMSDSLCSCWDGTSSIFGTSRRSSVGTIDGHKFQKTTHPRHIYDLIKFITLGLGSLLLINCTADWFSNAPLLQPNYQSCSYIAKGQEVEHKKVNQKKAEKLTRTPLACLGPSLHELVLPVVVNHNLIFSVSTSKCKCY